MKFKKSLWIVLFIFSFAWPQFAAEKRELLAIVQNGKYGYIDHAGKIIIPPQFFWAQDFRHGLGTVIVCGRYAFIDKNGNFSTRQLPIKGELERAKRGDKYGAINDSGKLIVAPTFDEMLPFSDGYAAVRMGEKWGFIDKKGRITINPQFENAFYFNQGVAIAEMEGEYVLINKSGKVIARGYTFSQGIVAERRVPAARGEKSGYLDLSGKEIIPFVYDYVDTFHYGLAAVKKENRWGYINRDGKTIIPFVFDAAHEFYSPKLAAVKKDETSGFIDQSGKFKFYLDFEHAPGFIDGDVSRFWTQDKFGYVNTSGKIVWGPTEGSPDHAPLFGLSEEAIQESCRDIPEAIKKKIAALPE